MGRLATLGRALRHRNYRLFIVGQGTSLIGTWMQQTALAWIVYDITQSSLLLGTMAVAAQLPTFFIAPLAGVLSDFASRRRILLVTQSVSMFQATILVILVATGRLEVWQILVLSGVIGVVNAFDMPTRQAFLVEMVPQRHDLANAIALNSSMVNGSRLVGPFIAGFLLAAFGELPCFLFNAFSYLAVILAYVAMRDLPDRPRSSGAVLRTGLLDGFRYAFAFPPIRALLVMMAVISMMAVPMSVLLPAYASDILRGGPQLYGLMTGATGVGALTAGLYLASRTTVLGLGRKMVWAVAALGLGMILFAFSRSTPLSLLLLVATGFSLMLHMASCNTLLQTIVDEDKRGRVMSFHAMAFMGTAPVGSLFAGAIADRFGPPAAIVLGGSVSLIAAAIFAWRLPRLRQHVIPVYQRTGILPSVATALEVSAELKTPPEEAA